MRKVKRSIVFTFLILLSLSSCSDNKRKETVAISKKMELEPTIKVHPELDTKPLLQINTSNTKIEVMESESFNYDLSSPIQTSVLNAVLIEISALSYDLEDKVLYTVNDEMGTLFSIDPTNGGILDAMEFGKKGDYEGVEIVEGSTIYVVKSNGNMVAIQKSNGETTNIKTALQHSNDVEGLGYNKNANMLLLACKGSPYISKFATKTKDFKCVYGWSIDSASLIEKPILTIRDDALIGQLERQEINLSKTTEKRLKKRLKDFSPSGIAYNQAEELYYIISSSGKTLITVNERSDIQHIEFLDDANFAQPEGICFGEDNALYISNEGRGLVAKLMKFEAKQKK